MNLSGIPAAYLEEIHNAAIHILQFDGWMAEHDRALADGATPPPRVLTKAEMEGLEEGTVLWEEYIHGSMDAPESWHFGPALVVSEHRIISEYLDTPADVNEPWFFGDDEYDEYGEKYEYHVRYWLGKPTEAERMAEAWSNASP